LYRKKEKKSQRYKYYLRSNKFMILRNQNFIFSFQSQLLSFPEVAKYLKQKKKPNGRSFQKRKESRREKEQECSMILL